MVFIIWFDHLPVAFSLIHYFYCVANGWGLPSGLSCLLWVRNSIDDLEYKKIDFPGSLASKGYGDIFSKSCFVAHGAILLHYVETL